MSKHLKNYFQLAGVVIIAAAVFSWALYRLIYETIGSILEHLGVAGGIEQNIIIIILVGAFLLLSGKKLKDLI